MTTSTDRSQNIRQLSQLITDIDCGMLTTVDEDGSLHSRPMSRGGDLHSEPTLWFFTSASSHKVFEIERHQQVNVSFSTSDSQRYISISGTAELVKDQNKMQELWQPKLQTWFPQGLNDPDLILLKVNIKKADYWDSNSSFSPKTIRL
ncbi:MAG: pyridoxamine 5'-phosphate oxidase family protein [Goleter apudmare HA4340-LM2]|jgi:general stress protein 26|nr:pyridoxamine 5'-phosphate oxidase family protein [Goleter apudmare HA4340-LM2]